MASYTGNLNLKKPALDDDALITDINNNMDILDAAVNGIQDGLAIVANGNTHVAITSGQFVYVRNHGTLTEGLYVANTNIAANATLSSSNLTADAAGGLNALNNKLANILKIETISNVVTDSNGMYISNYDMEKVVSAYIATSTQLFVLVRPSTNGKAVMYVYQYNGTTLVPKPNETVSINVWVKE